MPDAGHNEPSKHGQATTTDKNLETPCRVFPLSPVAMLKKLQNLVFNCEKRWIFFATLRGGEGIKL